MNELKNKIALITGATGLIGSNLVERLLAEGAKVIALGRNAEKIKEIFKEHLTDTNFSYETVDISNGIPEGIDHVDYIFHAASSISGAEIKARPVDVIRANLGGTENCLEFLRQQKERREISGKMIIFSSATVYGNSFSEDKSVLEKETNMAETLDCANASYSESKRMIEVIARSYYAQYHIESVIVRIGYVYGYTKRKPGTAFYEFIDKVLAGEDIIVNNSGMGRRDNIFVGDVVNGLLLVALNGIAGEAYNLASNGEKDNFKAIDEIAQIIADTANELDKEKKIYAYIKESIGERNAGIMLDNQKIKALGWSVETSMRDGIRETIGRYMGKR